MKENEDNYYIIGDNNNYDLIRQNFFNVKLEENVEIPLDIINTFATENNLIYNQNENYIFEKLNEKLTFKLRDLLLAYDIKLILE